MQLFLRSAARMLPGRMFASRLEMKVAHYRSSLPLF